jgi:hypothetical protein
MAGYAVEPHDAADLTEAAGFSQRVKALATTAPLHDLDARKTSVQSGDWAAYQMAELSLHAVDLVTIAMDFDAGARPEDVVLALADRVRTQAPDRHESEHAKVARWVLDNLLNVGSADRGFQTVYGETAAGAYQRRTFNFKLIEETLGADGEVYLRASNEAVNVLATAIPMTAAGNLTGRWSDLRRRISRPEAADICSRTTASAHANHPA